MSTKRMRSRFWVECFLSVLTASLTALTLIWHDWAETLFHVDPDRSNGSFEIGVTVVLAIITLTFIVTARSEWTRNRSIDTRS
jgi:hypothetical protein